MKDETLNESVISKWFSSATKLIVDKIPDNMVDMAQSKHPPIGEIVLFKYDPKTKDTLPYYDANPLILVTGFSHNGFSGINLHYIPPEVRKKLVDYMRKEKERSRSGLDYSRRVAPHMATVGGNQIFTHAYKNYLASHVRSRIAILKPLIWKLATALPFQSFVGATTSKVHADYRKRSRR